MTSSSIIGGLPVNSEDVIHRRVVEGSRVKFKAGWDEKNREAFIRTVCAFANDLHNLNGGYIILGIEERDGRVLLPPKGIAAAELDRIQREIAGACKRFISPEYLPLIFTERIEERDVIVVWAPAGDTKPYAAPRRSGEGRCYYVRSGSATLEAEGDLLLQIVEQTAKIPYDDRRSLEGTLADVQLPLVRQFLTEVRSRLADMEMDFTRLCQNMRLLVQVNAHWVPRNVALMFFNSDPERFFPYTRAEVAQFPQHASGDRIKENIFRGPVQDQIRSCLSFIDGLSGVLVEKIPGQAEARHTRPYPLAAVEEAVVNAFHHRGYDAPGESVKIYIHPDRMEITSYPGPVAAITREHFATGAFPAAPSRNRRVGEFLKELRLAEMRNTGISKIKSAMAAHGSAEPRFDFDDDRTYFRVTLPIHPKFL